MRPKQYIFNFENCESFCVDPSNVTDITISGITKCLQFRHGEKRTFFECCAVSITLAPDIMLTCMGEGDGTQEVSADRLLKGDLVAIEIVGSKKSRVIYVPWKDCDDAGATNKLQRSERSEAGLQICIGLNFEDGDALFSLTGRRSGRRRRGLATETQS